MKSWKLTWILPVVSILMACDPGTDGQAGQDSTGGKGIAAPAAERFRFTAGRPHGASGGQKPLAKASQTRRKKNNYSIKSLDQVAKIKVYLGWSQGFPTMGPNWQAAAREAMSRWNLVAGTAVEFVETPNTIGGVGVWLQMNFIFDEDGIQDPSVCAEAYPTMDRQMNQVTVDLNHLREPENQLSHAAKVKAVMHALGQTLNIGQTDLAGLTFPDGSTYVHIAGTPTSDPNSLFQSNTCGTTHLFQPGDLKAITTLYPAGALLHRRSDTHLYTEGGEKLLANPVIDFQQEGDFIVALNSNRELYGKEGRSGTWYLMTTNVKSFVLGPTGNLAALKMDGNLYAKQNGLFAPFQWQWSSVIAMDMEGTRIAAIRSNGDAWAKDGLEQSNQNWRFIGSSASSVQLEGNRVGYRTTGKGLYIQEGLVAPTYKRLIRGDVIEYQLENAVFLMKFSNQELHGGYAAHIGSWDNVVYGLHDQVKKFQAEGDRIAVITGTANRLKIKDAFFAAWFDAGSNWKDFRMKGFYMTGMNFTLNGMLTTRYELEDELYHGVSADMFPRYN